jgi:hypothetical protein
MHSICQLKGSIGRDPHAQIIDAENKGVLSSAQAAKADEMRMAGKLGAHPELISASITLARKQIYDEFVGERKAMKRLACLNFKDDMSWGYIEGYRRAAELLAERMIYEGKDLDYLVYPMGYLYRHHIELQLKYLTVTIGEFIEEPDAPAKVHQLTEIWSKLCSKFKQISPDQEELLGEVGKGIQLLEKFDQSGQEFRYPIPITNSKKQSSLFQPCLD